MTARTLRFSTTIREGAAKPWGAVHAGAGAVWLGYKVRSWTGRQLQSPARMMGRP